MKYSKRDLRWQYAYELFVSRVNFFSFWRCRFAIGWVHRGPYYMDGKIARTPKICQVIMIQFPWGKVRGFRISSLQDGDIFTSGYRVPPGDPCNTEDTSIPDERGISVNSSLSEILAAMKDEKENGRPIIQ